MLNSSNSSKEEGNTIPPPLSLKKKQISPSKRWCFTYNNYPDDWKNIIVPTLDKCALYSIGEEIGETGTPHLQGYIEFNVKVRPLSVLKIKEIHWEKCKGSKIENLNYTQKEGKFIQNFTSNYIEEIDKFYDWQKLILNILSQEPDNRTIHWIWEPNGCAGKTIFQKYVFTHLEDVVVLSGKGSDMKNGIVSYYNLNNKLPKIVLINIPRCSKDFVSWAGIEEIKDMFFYSGKYEGGMICGASPHLVCFANCEIPVNYETGEKKLSEDRFKIYKI